MKYSLYLARKYAAEGWWDRAIRHYLTVLFTYQGVEQREIEFADEFRAVLENWMCYSRNADSCLSALFAPILNLFPKNVPIITLLCEHVAGRLTFVEDMSESGDCTYDCLKTAISVECDHLMGAVFRVSSANIRSSVFDQWHMFMINDKERNKKFFDALKNTVLPTDHVLDIGAGSGILSVFAARSGAARVTAIEANPTLYQVAKRVLALNGVDNAKVVHEHSYVYHPEEGDLADVVVSEILDCCAFGEGVIPAFLDAHERLTTNSARFIPSNATLFATLLESPSVYLSHSFSSPSGKEFRSEYVRCNEQEPHEPYWCARLSDIPDARKLSLPSQILSVDFQDVNDLYQYNNGVTGVLKIPVTCTGTLHAVSVHFRALIWGDQYIDTSKSTCWEQGLFPLSYPKRVNEGETIVLKWSLKKRRLDIVVDVTGNPEEAPLVQELFVREHLDYSSMNKDMLLFAISRILPSAGKYSWNFDEDLSLEERGVVRSLPHFLVDAKDVNGAGGDEDDEGYTEQYVVVWPIRSDGTVCEVFLNLLHSLRSSEHIPPSLRHCGFLTDRLSAHGVLVSSEHLSKLTRVQQESSCGVDLSPIQMYNLPEYRDVEISTFEHSVCSNEFRFLHLGEEDTELLTKTIEVRCTAAGLIEGVLYWWQFDNYSTRQDRAAFFTFKNSIPVSVGAMVSNEPSREMRSMHSVSPEMITLLACSLHNSISHVMYTAVQYFFPQKELECLTGGEERHLIF